MTLLSAEEWDELQYELKELRAEVARHHEAFQKISEIAEDAMSEDEIFLHARMQEIRNIVG